MAKNGVPPIDKASLPPDLLICTTALLLGPPVVLRYGAPKEVVASLPFPLLSFHEDMFPDVAESVTPSASRSRASNHTVIPEVFFGELFEKDDKSPMSGLLSNTGATLL